MLSFLTAASGMAAKIRDHDWAASSVGAMEGWTPSVKAIVGILLGANQPMFLAFGPERTLLYNDAYAPILGAKHPKALGLPFLDVWSEIREDLLPIVDRAYGGTPVHMDEIRLTIERHGYREEAFFSFSYTPVRGEGGAIDGFLCVCNEITGQVTAYRRLEESEAELRSSEAQFRTLAQAVPNQVWMATDAGRLDWFNDKVFSDTGLAAGDLSGDGWTRLVHPADLPAVAANWAAALAAVTLYESELRLRMADGTYRWHMSRAEPVRSEDGTVRWIGTNADIHGQKMALSEMNAERETLEREMEKRTRERNRLWENSQDISIVIDREGAFRAVNPAMTKTLGWLPEEMIGRPVFDFILEGDLPATQTALEQANVQAIDPTTVRYRHKDGSFRWIAWVAAPEDDLIFATGRNVTGEMKAQADLALAQEALRQAQKMEAVGQLTGGIAHDFNNMLAVVIGSLDLLGRRMEGADTRTRRYVDNAMEGARRAATLTQRLLAFSRQQPLSPEAIDANRLVSTMSDLLRRTLSGGIRLETVIGGGLWRCHADPNQLENAILNLAVNARDAMPDGGRLTIETQNAYLDARYVAGHVGVASGQYVLIAVTDTGEGMAPAIIEKAFDPFFTTKEVGKGTGLGLSQVYGFVKQSGGHVKIYSEPGRGTTVKLYLPRFMGEGEAAGEMPGEEAEAQAPATEFILVVEDDDQVRRMTLDALQELGYKTLEANGAAEALRLLELHPSIDVLFTDIVMPDIDGRRLADEALRRRPDLKVLFTTGYTRNAVVHNGVLDSSVDLLTKPFTVDELADKMRDVVERP
ncbi:MULTISPECIES: PAS domain-containing sensor histidine kinase [unclassified Aureimonas]|uniref:hybrid sensor histidine kinase/response regulator n=1 Tax=unclassified Aureimonas TaxID=2615206 RepID=UPI0006FC5D23|nr:MULTISPECIES: PAS domain-containing sensor histidine kinase [unclassified Aureimonas]KQT64056.1 hypothetical protein ASG62_03300 [Aureimonas sp. Leaf427]KQT81248.1 hypothetical protein ASG54_00570 [Aureimonas sp. Leaf460]